MIPQVIHQIWIDRRIPERFVGFRDSFLRHHPGWTYRLWTDADIADFIRAHEPELVDLYEGHARAICRADIARYLILKNLGGLYVDLDFECLRPLDPLLAGAELAIGLEPATHVAGAAQARGLTQILCPSLIASCPGHPFWTTVVEDLWRARDEADVLDATGPFLLTRTHHRLSAAGSGGDIRLLPPEQVYPVDKFAFWGNRLFDLVTFEQATREAYALHHWDGGWFRAPAERAGQHELKIALTGPEVSERAPAAADPLPLVSCLMVTRDRPAQARLAVACFRAQTYPNRELVIVEDGTDTALAQAVAGDPRIRHHRTGDPQPNLGRARNRAVALARGAYVCQWDDDDLYDPLRIEMQLAALRRSGAQACLLARWTVWWPRAERLAIARRRPWEGSLLCERARLPAYPELTRGEDTPVTQALLAHARVAHLDAPRLYLYVVHGTNTFESAHFDAHWDAAEARFEGARYAAVFTELAKRLPVGAYARVCAGSPPPAERPAPEPDFAAAVGAAARLLMQDRLVEAEAAFEALRRRRPDDPAGLDGLARVASRTGNWAAAIVRWDEVHVVHPDHGPGALGRGQALLELGRFDEAEAAFGALRAGTAHRLQALVGLAELAARRGDWRRALAAWRALLAEAPGMPRARLGVIRALAELGDLARAEAALRAAPDLDPADQLRARALLLQKRHRDGALAELLAQHPEIVRADPALRALVFHLAQGQGQARQALAHLAGGAETPLVAALAAAYDPEADPDPTLSALHALWQEHGAAIATPDLLALFVRAGEHERGQDGARGVLATIDVLPLDSIRAIRLRLTATFERLRLTPGAGADAAMRGLAAQAEPRAPFGAWRDVLYRLAQTYALIATAFPDACIDSAWRAGAADAVVARILDAVRARRPLSLIRLGDGEGNFLAYPEAQAWHAPADREATQRIWWGEPRLAASEAAGLSAALQAAVAGADIVGVPDPARLCTGLPLPCPEDPYASGHDLRGLLVIVDHLRRAAIGEAGALFRRDQLLTSCHIHADLAAQGLYETLFAQIRTVSLITCHAALAERLRARFGLEVARTILIPHERKYGTAFGYATEEQHYPDVFERLRATLAPTHPGEVVLVAAGFLGKLYCHWIAERGGIALDLGSIVDHWCGFSTRSLQFRQRYAGPVPPRAAVGARAMLDTTRPEPVSETASPERGRAPSATAPSRSAPASAPATTARPAGVRIARDRTALQAWLRTRSEPVGVNLYAEPGQATGIGRAGAGLAAAFEAAGIPLHRIDVHAARGAEPPFPVNVFHLNPWSLLDRAVWQTGVFDAQTFAHRYNIGVWAWETPTAFPEGWRPAFGLLDEIWAPSTFGAQALRAVAPIPVRVIPHALDLPPVVGLRKPVRAPGPFRIGFAFDGLSGFSRKNPLGLIEAVRRAFPAGGAELALKARTLSEVDRAQIEQAFRGDPALTLALGEWDRAELLNWIGGCDVYASLHRAEAFGLTLAEAMAMGTPVVATAYGGSCDFLDAATGYPIPFAPTRLEAAVEAYPAGTVWAEPDLDAAAAALRAVRDEPAAAAARATRARESVRARFSAAAVGRQLRGELDRILAETSARPAAPAPQRGGGATPAPKVLVLTPVRNAAHALEAYGAALCALDYPAASLSVAFLEGGSRDASAAHVRDLSRTLRARGHRVSRLHEEGPAPLAGPRWAPEVQAVRRAGIARARNALLAAALGDEDWVLWIDADVVAYPPDVLARLIDADRDVVVPHCVLTPGGPTFDLNSFRRTGPDGPLDETGLYQPARGEGRMYLENLRGQALVELDGVGGSMLLVRAAIHRQGIVFPTEPVAGLIETEGFAVHARAAGYRAWGVPDLEIYHAQA